MSSAHVYLRLPEGSGLDDIPADTLEDCAQLVKQNSIQGGCGGLFFLLWCYSRTVRLLRRHLPPPQQQQQHVGISSRVAAGCGPVGRGTLEALSSQHAPAMVACCIAAAAAAAAVCWAYVHAHLILDLTAGLLCCVLCAVPAGCKSNDVQIVYTPWGNLKKTASMDVGQVWDSGSSCMGLQQRGRQQSTCNSPACEMDTTMTARVLQRGGSCAGIV
jgi:hypothetical protein